MSLVLGNHKFAAKEIIVCHCATNQIRSACWANILQNQWFPLPINVKNLSKFHCAQIIEKASYRAWRKFGTFRLRPFFF